MESDEQEPMSTWVVRNIPVRVQDSVKLYAHVRGMTIGKALTELIELADVEGRIERIYEIRRRGRRESHDR